MDTATTTKPRYLGLLNAISLAETHAGIYLRAWADATTDEELACTLRLVAARETSHGELFCRRLCELGYELRQKPDPKAAERVAKYANPKISDCDKAGRARGEVESDPFGEIEQKLKEGFYDPMTANLLGWYICEERDTGRRLREAYAKVRVKAGEAPRAKKNGNGAVKTNGADVSADAQAIMACMADGFARLERKLENIAAR
jgi:rubrerythrin